MLQFLHTYRDIFFPKLNDALHLISFADIAIKYLKNRGYEPYLCKNEDEARELVRTLPDQGMWPCLFTKSNTTGEKDLEEFYTDNETLDMERFENMGIIKSELEFNEKKLNEFEEGIIKLKSRPCWEKNKIVNQFHSILTNFDYKDKGKYLDEKM